MAIVYTDITPIIPNTTMQKMTVNGVDRQYKISPISGYVLHGKTRDWIDVDPETGEETFYRGYGRGDSTVAISYDFDNTIEIEGYTAYGAREIFARPESEVPDNQIFGGGNNNHEVM